MDLRDKLDEICPSGRKLGVALHSGFQHAWLVIQKKIQAGVVKKYYAVHKANPTKPIKIFFAGHSLGAALATLATYDYWCNDWFLPPYCVAIVTAGYRNQNAADTMSDDDCRNTLIVELKKRLKNSEIADLEAVSWPKDSILDMIGLTNEPLAKEVAKSRTVKDALVGTITFGHAFTFHGSDDIQHFQKIVPKERRMRVNACGWAPGGIVPGVFGGITGLFKQKCDAPTRPTKPVEPARCKVGCGNKCDKNCHQNCNGRCNANCNRNCNGRCNANCGHQCRQKGWWHKGGCIAKCEWNKGQCHVRCRAEEAKCTWNKGKCHVGCKADEAKCGVEIVGCRTKCVAEVAACKIGYGIKLTAYGIKYAAYLAAHVLYLACQKAADLIFSGKPVATCDGVGASSPNSGYVQPMDMDWQSAWVRDDDVEWLGALQFKFGHCWGFPRAIHCHLVDRYMQGLRVHNRLNGGICSKISDPRNKLNLTPKPHGGGQEGFPARVHLKNVCGACVRHGLVDFKTAASMPELACRHIAIEAVFLGGKGGGVDEYTQALTGGTCSFDPKRKDCAICRPNAQDCGRKCTFQCVKRTEHASNAEHNRKPAMADCLRAAKLQRLRNGGSANSLQAFLTYGKWGHVPQGCSFANVATDLEEKVVEAPEYPEKCGPHKEIKCSRLQAKVYKHFVKIKKTPTTGSARSGVQGGEDGYMALWNYAEPSDDAEKVKLQMQFTPVYYSDEEVAANAANKVKDAAALKLENTCDPDAFYQTKAAYIGKLNAAKKSRAIEWSRLQSLPSTDLKRKLTQTIIAETVAIAKRKKAAAVQARKDKAAAEAKAAKDAADEKAAEEKAAIVAAEKKAAAARAVAEATALAAAKLEAERVAAAAKAAADKATATALEQKAAAAAAAAVKADQKAEVEAKAKAKRDEQAAKDADAAAKALVEKNAAAEAAAKVSRDAATADTQESSPPDTDVLLRQALMKDVNADESTEAAGETETDKCGEIINIAHKSVLCRDPTTKEVADYRGKCTKKVMRTTKALSQHLRATQEYAARKATLVASAYVVGDTVEAKLANWNKHYPGKVAKVKMDDKGGSYDIHFEDGDKTTVLLSGIKGWEKARANMKAKNDGKVECTVVVPQGLGTSWEETKDLLASEKKHAASLKVDVEELEIKLEKLAVAPAAGANANEAAVSPIPGGSLPAGVPQIEALKARVMEALNPREGEGVVGGL